LDVVVRKHQRLEGDGFDSMRGFYTEMGLENQRESPPFTPHRVVAWLETENLKVNVVVSLADCASDKIELYSTLPHAMERT